MNEGLKMGGIASKCLHNFVVSYSSKQNVKIWKRTGKNQ